MPASPVTIRARHTARLGLDVIGHWRHNGARWPAVVLLVVAALVVVAVL